MWKYIVAFAVLMNSELNTQSEYQFGNRYTKEFDTLSKAKEFKNAINKNKCGSFTIIFISIDSSYKKSPAY